MRKRNSFFITVVMIAVLCLGLLQCTTTSTPVTQQHTPQATSSSTTEFSWEMGHLVCDIESLILEEEDPERAAERIVPILEEILELKVQREYREYTELVLGSIDIDLRSMAGDLVSELREPIIEHRGNEENVYEAGCQDDWRGFSEWIDDWLKEELDP